MPRNLVREVSVQGRALFIPVVAFSVRYSWAAGGQGHTAASYLVGRQPSAPDARMAPFRLDQGPRIYASVSQRPAQVAVRV